MLGRSSCYAAAHQVRSGSRRAYNPRRVGGAALGVAQEVGRAPSHKGFGSEKAAEARDGLHPIRVNRRDTATHRTYMLGHIGPTLGPARVVSDGAGASILKRKRRPGLGFIPRRFDKRGAIAVAIFVVARGSAPICESYRETNCFKLYFCTAEDGRDWPNVRIVGSVGARERSPVREDERREARWRPWTQSPSRVRRLIGRIAISLRLG